MLRRWRKAQGQDIMIHTCESGHFVIWSAFAPIPLPREGGRERRREKGREAGGL